MRSALLILVCGTLVVACSGDSGSGGTGGDTAGDPVAGDSVAGDSVAGDPVAGDPVAGDPVAGDPVAGDPVAGDPVAGDPVAGDPVAGDPVAGDPVAGDPVAGDSTPGLAPPQLTAVQPAGLCAVFSATEITVQGSGFVVLGSSLATPDAVPSVTFGAVGDAPIIDIPASTCAAMTVPVIGFVCTELVVGTASLVDGEGNFLAYDEPITVTNPQVGGSQGVSNSVPPVAVITTPPPQITSTLVAIPCEVQTFDLLGSAFQPGAAVRLSDQFATPVIIDSLDYSGVTLDTSDTDSISVALATPLTAGIYAVTLVNPDGCSDSVGSDLVVEQPPKLLGLDTPTVYQNITTRFVAYLLAGSGSVNRIELLEDGAASPSPVSLSSLFNPDEPNLIRADVPGDGASFLAAGAYTLRLSETTGCSGSLNGAIHVEDALTVSVDSVGRPFGVQGEPTTITIRGDSFVDLPHTYLSRVGMTSGETAVPLRGVTFADTNTLEAVVPATGPSGQPLPAGDYDLIVVNPDGTVGVSPAGGIFHISAAPAPEVRAISPQRFSINSPQPVTISGSEFNSPRVSYICLDSNGVPMSEIVVPMGDLVVTSATRLTAPAPTSYSGTIDEGSLCVVRVSNSTEGTFDEYSAVPVAAQAGNLFAIAPGPPLNEARRAPAVAEARLGHGETFIYAIGGDQGAVASASQSIEATRLDLFGRPGGWSYLPSTRRARSSDAEPPLPGARTLAAAARVGGYIYLVGGNDAAAPVDSVWRSQVLEPIDAPSTTGFFISINTDIDGQLAGGLAPGVWRYRIAALFDDTDFDNPEGESLASRPMILRVPDLNPDDDGSGNDRNGLIYLPNWGHVANAIGYRIYRGADTSGSSEELLADVLLAAVMTPGEISALLPGDDLMLFTDDGSGTTDAQVTPAPLGALGAWHLFADLPAEFGGDETGREAPCAVVAADPCNPDFAISPIDLSVHCAGVTNPNDRYYLYVAGGRDGAGIVRDTVHGLPLWELSSGSQITPGWLTWSTPVTLPDARWQSGAVAVSSELHTVVADYETWVYFGQGLTQSGIASTQDMLAGRVLAGGQLTSTAALSGPTPTRIGYGMVAASNFIYVFGGERAPGPTLGATEAQLSSPATLGGWNNVGGGVELSGVRALPGVARAAGFIFIIGGMTDDGSGGSVATGAVDLSHY